MQVELGNRTFMMDSGRIVLHVRGEAHTRTTVQDMLAQFKVGAGKALNNDRFLLSRCFFSSQQARREFSTKKFHKNPLFYPLFQRELLGNLRFFSSLYDKMKSLQSEGRLLQ